MNFTLGKSKSQIFSIDFLLASLILAVAFGIFLNSYSSIQKSSLSGLHNASAFAIAEGYFESVSSGSPLPAECSPLQNGLGVSCDACPSPGVKGKFFTQRIYENASSARSQVLKVGVCD